MMYGTPPSEDVLIPGRLLQIVDGGQGINLLYFTFLGAFKVCFGVGAWQLGVTFGPFGKVGVEGSNVMCVKFLGIISVRFGVRLEPFGRVGVEVFGFMIAISSASRFLEHYRCVSESGFGSWGLGVTFGPFGRVGVGGSNLFYFKFPG